jgi:hypothetical protein
MYMLNHMKHIQLVQVGILVFLNIPGHKRCHRGTAGVSDSISATSSNKETSMQQQMPARLELLDLNLKLDEGHSYLQSNGGKRAAEILQVHQLKCHQSCYQLNDLWRY